MQWWHPDLESTQEVVESVFNSKEKVNYKPIRDGCHLDRHIPPAVGSRRRRKSFPQKHLVGAKTCLVPLSSLPTSFPPRQARGKHCGPEIAWLPAATGNCSPRPDSRPMTNTGTRSLACYFLLGTLGRPYSHDGKKPSDTWEPGR